ncbi:hypothetical protein [Burkholderia stabilis]|uniref:hypothetical protein n=1 Tax=Burkholderia stabilis TaxID=95485 RepID=UPI0012FE7361|nr:hypothetical protein [Burkholderia stabilis]
MTTPSIMIGIRAVMARQGYVKAGENRMNAGRRCSVPDARPVPSIRPIGDACVRADPTGVHSLDNC